MAPLQDLGGVLVVQARIDGKGPFNFVLDTGAGTTVVTPELSAQLHLAANGSANLGTSGKSAVSAGAVVLPSVVVGEASASKVAAVIAPLPPDLTYQGRFGRIAGILGATFLRQFVVTIDYGSGLALFAAPGTFVAPPDAQRMSASAYQGAVTVTGSVSGASTSMEIDSGNNGLSIVSAAFAQAHGLTARCKAIPRTHEGLGGRVRDTVMRVNDLTVGGIAVRDTLVAESSGSNVLSGDGAPGVILGNALLRQWGWLAVDYGAEIVYLPPEVSIEDGSVPYYTTGLSLVRRASGELDVDGVVDGSVAATAGVEAGDRVVSLDGVAAEQLGDADFAAASKNDTVRYVLARGGAQLEVSLTLFDALPTAGNCVRR
ncbi:MAG TPA: aspartyl protease family protein [Candidatus Cybelea sp.]|nr:aspartyl protease family protein [Candidatus Cybelea sp.]